jgi:high-affinity iron transporter
MFAAAIVVFRESLEAALIISIMMAATRGIPMRGRWVGGGVVLGLIGAAVVASSMEMISNLADGVGQELFNVAILVIAIGMLAWHNIWMSVHGKQLAQQISSTARAITDGSRERSVILLVVALAVLREGSETVLFLYGVATAGENGFHETLLGGAVGMAIGAVVATLLYAGLLRIPVRWFFTATSVLVLLLAASMASQAARLLIQADLLPSLATPLWDTSSVLSQNTALGTILHGLVGYEAQPAGMQVLAYITVLTAIAIGLAATQCEDLCSQSFLNAERLQSRVPSLTNSIPAGYQARCHGGDFWCRSIAGIEQCIGVGIKPCNLAVARINQHQKFHRSAALRPSVAGGNLHAKVLTHKRLLSPMICHLSKKTL